MKFTYKILLFLCLSFAFSACEEECIEDTSCFLIGETGPCRAIFTRYFYNRDTGKCEEFTWGGCEGVVPFETLEECEAGCGCD